MDVIWLLGQNFEDVGDVGLGVAPRVDRRTGRVEDFRAEDEGVGARDRFLSDAPLAVCNLSVAAPSRMVCGLRLPDLAKMTRAASRFRTRSSTLRPKSCWVKLPATLATNGPVPMNGSAARSRPASAASAGGSMWTRSTSRPASPTASRATVASPASLTIPISRMPASCRACSPSVMRGVLATGASSRLSGRSDQTFPRPHPSREAVRALLSYMRNEQDDFAVTVIPLGISAIGGGLSQSRMGRRSRRG